MNRQVNGKGFWRWRMLLIGLLALVASGCAVRFVYNQLDWLIPWYLEDYIALEGAQKPLFKSRLKNYLAWHRQEQLPRYADFLEEVAVYAERGLGRAEVEAIQQRTKLFAQALIDRLQPDMIELFALASDDQVTRLFRKFDEDNARAAKNYLGVSTRKQQQQQVKEAIHYVERWTGSLRKDQRQLVEEWGRGYEPMGQALAETQLAWQQEFHRILLLRQQKDAYESAFKALLANPEFGRTPALQQMLDRNEQSAISLYLQLDKSLDQGQRAQMVKKLRRYAADFRRLSSQR